MISFLRGQVRDLRSENLTLLVGGVGYLVRPPASLIAKTSAGREIELHIHTHVREDALDLYGFATAEELTLFELLLGVSGIGPKTALTVIDRGVEATRNAVIKADEGFFMLIPRLGRKNAQKIIIELKSKLGSLTNLDLTGETAPNTELLDALTTMGYSRQQAVNAVRKLPPDIGSLEEQIRFLLKKGI